MSTAKKLLLWNYHIVWIERGLYTQVGTHFQSARQHNYFLSVYPKFTSKISLLISISVSWLKTLIFDCLDLSSRLIY